MFQNKADKTQPEPQQRPHFMIAIMNSAFHKSQIFINLNLTAQWHKTQTGAAAYELCTVKETGAVISSTFYLEG